MDEVKQAVRARWQELRQAGVIGEPDRCGKGLICPQCGSGSGKHGTGLGEIPGSGGSLRCYACDWHGDAITLIEHYAQCGFMDALRIGANALGLPFPDKSYASSRSLPKKQTSMISGSLSSSAALVTSTPDSEALEEIRGMPLRAQAALERSPVARSYLEERGISLETARSCGLGYLPDPAHPRIIVPTGGETYQYRVPGETTKFPKGGRVHPFNASVLRGIDPVFIVEGWEDALSIIEAGGTALALNGTPHFSRLLDILDFMQQNGESIPPLILALDNDPTDETTGREGSGPATTRKLSNQLKDRRIFHIIADLYGDVKDANDALRKDFTAFAVTVERAQRSAKEKAEDTELPQESSGSESSSQDLAVSDEQLSNWHMASYASVFHKHIRSGRNAPVSTGFRNLDDLLGGGFRPGLYLIGANTGAGKTTFCLQIADHIAAAGRPVLYVALEMSRDELAAKSISRISQALSEEFNMNGGRTMDTILDGASDALIHASVRRYFETIGPNLYILEGLGNIGVEDVSAVTEAIQKSRGKAPFIVVDYLQILAPSAAGLTDKQTVDRNVCSLKRLSRDLAVPVLAVSSFNRVGYSRGTNDKTPKEQMQSAFKESGGIEYTGDGLLGLYRVKDTGNGQMMEVCLLKGRRLPDHDSIRFNFHGEVSLFSELRNR